MCGTGKYVNDVEEETRGFMMYYEIIYDIFQLWSSRSYRCMNDNNSSQPV